MRQIFNVTILLFVVLIPNVYAQKLPSNYEYKRETGQESGVPIFILTPLTEAMAYDAVRGSTFEALGAIAQPEREKYGLVFYNAKDDYQLDVQQARGVFFMVDGTEYKIQSYVLGPQVTVARLKLESAVIAIDAVLFWKIVRANDVFIRVGSVAYSLDEDNIDALHYFGDEIEKDISRRTRKRRPGF